MRDRSGIRASLRGAVAVLAVGGVVAADASAHSQNLRNCEKPFGPGIYIAATSNVHCKTAFYIAHHITQRRCWSKEQCGVHGFQCISYWHGHFRRPFSFTHHGICTASRDRRIEFDLG